MIWQVRGRRLKKMNVTTGNPKNREMNDDSIKIVICSVFTVPVCMRIGKTNRWETRSNIKYSSQNKP